jgi:hypothetical protein
VREDRRLKKKLAKIRAKEQAARGKTKESRLRRQIRKEKREVQRGRVDLAVDEARLREEQKKTQTAAREAVWKERQKRYRELLREAERTGQLPRRVRTPFRIDSERNVGEQVAVRFGRTGRVLKVSTIEDALHRIDAAGRELPGHRQKWLTKIVFSTFGEGLKGSGQRLLVSSSPDASSFYVQAFDSTGAWLTHHGMTVQLRTILEDLAYTKHTIVRLHEVKIMNFEAKKAP